MLTKQPPFEPPTAAKPAAPVEESQTPSSAQQKVEPLIGFPSVVELVSSSVDTVLPSSSERTQTVLLPSEPPRIQVLITAPNLLALSGQHGFLLTGMGSLMVLIAFFMSWFHISSPLANVFLSGLAAFEMSGMTMLTGFSDLHLPGSPIVSLIPLLALGTGALSARNFFKRASWGHGHGIVEIILAVLGIAFMLILFLLNRTAMDEIFRQLSIPSVVGQKIYSVEPTIGFWLTLAGFILMIGSAIWTWQRNQVK